MSFFLVEERKDRNEDQAMPLFDIDTILAATNNFSNNNKIGEGGFGPVYKVNFLILIHALKGMLLILLFPHEISLFLFKFRVFYQEVRKLQ